VGAGKGLITDSGPFLTTEISVRRVKTPELCTSYLMPLNAGEEIALCLSEALTIAVIRVPVSPSVWAQSHLQDPANGLIRYGNPDALTYRQSEVRKPRHVPVIAECSVGHAGDDAASLKHQTTGQHPIFFTDYSGVRRFLGTRNEDTQRPEMTYRRLRLSSMRQLLPDDTTLDHGFPGFCAHRFRRGRADRGHDAWAHPVGNSRRKQSMQPQLIRLCLSVLGLGDSSRSF
jgi:hypothetical protein